MKLAVLDASVVPKWCLALKRKGYHSLHEGLYKAVKKNLPWVKWLGDSKYLFTTP